MSDPTKLGPFSRTRRVSGPLDALPPASTIDPLNGPRADLARAIPRRQRVSWRLGVGLAIAFAVLVIPTITAERWLGAMGIGTVSKGHAAPLTVRVPPFAGYDTPIGHQSGGGVAIGRGEIADGDTALDVRDLQKARPHGGLFVFAFLLLLGVLAGLFTHHMRRSTHGRLLRVQLVSLATIVIAAVVVKILMLTTALSVLIVPVAVFAMVPTLVLDRIVGLATGTLAALVVAFIVPFDVGVAVMLLVQAAAAGLVVAERPKHRLRALLVAGAVATLFTAATYPLMLYLSLGRLPLAELHHPLHSAWVASALGPAIATGLAIVSVPIYQLLVGEITTQKLVELEDMSHPLLKQISDKAPGTWQHSLTMANMAEIAANAIGANGRLVRVGAYFHDLGKSLNPKYFIENLEPGETSPHDKLPPDASCDAIFAHVTEGILTARRAGLHERIIDFMHMHHGNGVLEYFWAKCREQGNPKKLTVEHFRYPGVPPQSRETAILSICDAVEAAARTLKKPEVAAIDNLVQRIVYGKLHLGQLDESGLSMGDLRRVAESLRETIRHANHGRIEYPWQKAQQDASAHPDHERLTQTGPRLDSLDRQPRPEVMAPSSRRSTDERTARLARDSNELAMKTTAPVASPGRAKREVLEEFEQPTEPAIPPGASAGRTRPEPSTPRDSAVAQAWRSDAYKDISSEIPLEAAPRPGLALSGPLPTDNDLTVPAPKLVLDLPPRPARSTLPVEEEDVVIELERPTVSELAGTLGAEPMPTDSDVRLRRATNPLEERKPSEATAKFVEDAKEALEDVARDVSAGVPAEPLLDAPSAAARAAALPPKKSPTQPPPLGRRSPTIPPGAGNVLLPPPSGKSPTIPPLPGILPLRSPTQPPPASSLPALGRTPTPGSTPAVGRSPTHPPFEAPALGRTPTPGSTPAVGRSPTRPPLDAPRPASPTPSDTTPPPGVLRPPGPAHNAPAITVPPPGVVRAPGINYLDDMITLRPQYEPKPQLRETKEDDGSVTIEPAQDDASTTQPRLAATSPDEAEVGDDTNPEIDLRGGAPLGGGPESSWARGLAARIEAQFGDDFGNETPISAPTKAELQALLNSPPDPTRRQSLDELERLHRESREARERRSEKQELEFKRRPGYPTAEIDESDIEAAIELVPPARRNVIGVAKKKPKKE